jgi:hypothetical protein
MKIQGVRLQGTKLIPSGAAVVESDTYFNLVSLLLPGNGTNGAQNNTFQDSSSNSLTVTRAGNTTQGTFSPFSQTGWSNYFDGTGDYLSVGTTQLWTPSNDLTIEGWFNISTTGDRCIFSKDAGSSGSSRGIIIYITSTGAVSVFYSVTGSSEAFATSSTGLVVANQWYHFAVVKNGSSCAVYLNGVSIVTFTAATIACPASQINYIGAFNGGAFLMLGYISNLRLVNGTAVYTTNFTPPTAPLTAITNTSLLTCQSNRFVDNSSNAFVITVAGNTSVQAFAPFDPTTAYSAATVGGSAYLDGSGDYLTISNPASLLTFGTGDFTIECFVYPTVGSSSSYVCWIYGTTVVINAIIINSNTGAVTFRLRGTNLSETDVTSSTGLLRVGEWTHLALVRTGTNFYGYVNGTRFSTTIASNAAFNEAQAQFFTQPQIGAKSNTVGDYFTGYVSGWRALKGTALYTAATITVPTAPLTAIANTSTLLNSTNGGIIDAAAKNVLETVGGAAISTAQSKFGGSSMAFDGTGDYLITRDNPNFVYGTGDFTIEFWVRFTATGEYMHMYDQRPALTDGAYPTIRLNQTGNGLEYVLSSAVRISGGSITTGVWYHIAVARAGTSTKMFLDGTQVGSTYTDSTNYLNGTNRPFIGGSGYHVTSLYFQGYINDLRITKGYARYTANFTAPTQAFPTQ